MRSLLISCFVLGVAGCGTRLTPYETDLFQYTEEHIGEVVRVRGHLNYKFEDHNLYPSADRKYRSKYGCLPLGLYAKDVELGETARRLSGSFVVVEGRVERLLKDRTVISFSYCKKTGLIVQSIMPAEATIRD